MLDQIDKIIMIRKYGGFNKKTKGVIKCEKGKFVAYFGRNRKHEKWINTVLKNNLAKPVIIARSEHALIALQAALK